jgi:hypothetical protein
MLTDQSITDAKNNYFGLGCIIYTQISLLLYELGITTIAHVFSNSQSLIASIQNRFYVRTAVSHIATKYYVAADSAWDGEMYLSYIPTAEMLANCFTKQLPKPAL